MNAARIRPFAVLLPSTLAMFAMIHGLPAIAWADTPSEKCYLLSYFLGNGEDGLRIAASDDGLSWTMPTERFLLRPKIGGKLMRDPSIVEGPDGVFQMVWTTSWGDRVIGHASSSDLLTWSEQQAVPVMMHEPEARNCWAPEIFYDDATARYMIVWATTIPGRFPQTAGSSESDYDHRLYFTTTRDFREFSPTKLFFDPGYNVIDGFLAKAADRYLLFYKDERLRPEPKKVILMATADRVEGPYAVPAEPIVPHAWVEGPSAIKIGGRWIVYFDCYREHKYGAATSTDLQTWTEIAAGLAMPPGARHGTVLEVDRKVVQSLSQSGQ